MGYEMQEYEGPGGEMMAVQEVPLDALGSLTRAEIDSQIATAKRYPRSIKKFMDEARSVACLNPDVAQSCCYAKPQGNGVIEGPSVRLAEIAAHTFGNLRVGARITQETGNFLVAQAVAIDLEKNNAVQIEVRRRITDRSGRRYKDDMIIQTANAAISIAYRNAVFKCVPSAFIQPIYREARRLAAGGGKSIEERRKNVADWIKGIGVKPAELFAFLGVKGWEDITIEHLETLAGVITALKDGESTVDDFFRPQQKPADNALPAPSKADGIAAELAAKAADLKVPLAGSPEPQPEPAAVAPPPITEVPEGHSSRKRSLFPKD